MSKELGFAVLDTETTGVDAYKTARVIELAVVHVDLDGNLTNEWSTLINPQQSSTGAVSVHKIRPSDVATAPTFAQLIPQISQVLTNRVIVAHNVNFDLKFLKAEYARAGNHLAALPTLCTYRSGRKILPKLENYKLASCCSAIGVNIRNAHRALDDARGSAHLLSHYLKNDRIFHAQALILASQASRISIMSDLSAPKVPLRARQ